MLLVKNPWGHMCFKGKFSVNDTKNWTPELKQALKFEMLENKDNGVFWIDLDTFCKVYERIYINWNPNLLIYRKSFFDLWKCADMSNGDYISVKTNP